MPANVDARIREVSGGYFAVSTQVVAQGQKARLHSLTAIGTAAAGLVQVRSGGAAGTVVYRVETEAVAGRSTPVPFTHPIRLDDGLYLELSNAAASISYE